MEPGLDAPQAIEVVDLGQKLWITRRRFYWPSVPLGSGALVWLGLTLCGYAHDLLNACSCIFLGLGLWVLYIAVLSPANRTEIEVNHQEMTIWHEAAEPEQEQDRSCQRHQSALPENR